MAMRVSFNAPSAPALPYKYSIERVADRQSGHQLAFLDFADSTFKSSGWTTRLSPDAPDPRALEEATIVHADFAGCFNALLDTSSTVNLKSQFPNGDYVVRLHDPSNGNQVIAQYVTNLPQGHDDTTFVPNQLQGSGEILVDQDFGGTGNLKFVDAVSGQPVGDGRVRAYLLAEWNSSLRDTSHIRGETTTDPTGAWRLPMMLDAGSYVFIYWKPGIPTTQRKDVVVS